MRKPLQTLESGVPLTTMLLVMALSSPL